MMPDDQLDRLLNRLPVEQAGDDMAARIVQRATAMPQRSGFRLMGARILSRLTSPWPDDMLPKVAALAMVILITFAAGINQEQSLTQGPNIVSLAYGDVDEGESL